MFEFNIFGMPKGVFTQSNILFFFRVNRGDTFLCFYTNVAFENIGFRAFFRVFIPASLAGAGDIDTHRVRLSVCPSVRPSVRQDEFVQAISQLLFTVGG